MAVKVFFIALVAAVAFVNGWTDAPNAISSCISTRSLTPRRAVALAAVCNLAGAILPALISSSVAEGVYSIIDFGTESEIALRSLCAGMSAVVVWAVLAFLFGIPTSESHALLSGICGAALGAGISPSAVNLGEWGVILFGLLASTLPAYLIARFLYSAILNLCASLDRREAIKYFTKAQKLSAAGTAFAHGAQDSQKFVGVLMLGLSLEGSTEVFAGFRAPVWISLGCAIVMTLGTMCGGTRIIKKVGQSMVNLDAAAGTASDAASSVTLGICTFFGIPVSTTHSKTCAMMGAGSLTGRGVDRSVARQMLLAWALTFPACALIGYVLGRLCG